MFHTRDKNFLILHPTSYFSYKPKSLEPVGREQPDPLQPNKKCLVSHNHQLLAYHTLLETAKPYLIMPARVPALHSALLFSTELDTSGTCQTIIADRWLEFRIHQVYFVFTQIVQEFRLIRNFDKKFRLMSNWEKTCVLDGIFVTELPVVRI